ncbi:putative neutral sphingomyelinase [Stomoxys calcitrans]|uniref:sphingomyelin phosphodiesterase n=1 Tax=Stomoxys calcitrans TaxID=35570 RepID=A0A1I8P9S1_STOCA|nr:putative neutral sphingomyelinase [Stomoxys calcitrans]
MVSLELSVLTLNVWGIPFVSSDRAERMQQIGQELSSGKYDIVSLQEVWTEKDSLLLQELTKAILPYAHYFYSGVIGAGLLVLSKYPIVTTLFHSWTVNGYCHRIQHADWFGGKGVGLCRIRVADRYVHLYNAHLHAEYDLDNDDYKTHRVIQAFDTAQFIEATRWDADVQILAGDLNAKPMDISYKVLIHTAELKDTCNKESTSTNESKHNSYTSKKARKQNPNGQRIDHILVRSSDTIKTTILEYKLPLPDRVPGKKFSYSDHEAVQVRLLMQTKQDGDTCSIRHIDAAYLSAGEGSMYDVKLTPPQTPTLNGVSNARAFDEGECPSEENAVPKSLPMKYALIKESIALCEGHLKKLKTDRIIYFCVALFLLAALIVMAEFPVPHGYMTLYLLLKLLVFAVILFCAFMGSLWNLMERNGTLSGKTSMEMKLIDAQ